MAASKTKLQFTQQESGSTLTRRQSTTSRRSRLASNLSTMSYKKRGSFRGESFKVPKYQNSYRLEPHLPFNIKVSDRILRQVMTAAFADGLYNPEKSVSVCREAAAEIIDRLYKTDYDRVKYVVQITIVENANQSLAVAHGRLWDIDRDSYSVFVIEEPKFFAYGMVHVINYE